RLGLLRLFTDICCVYITNHAIWMREQTYLQQDRGFPRGGRHEPQGAGGESQRQSADHRVSGAGRLQPQPRARAARGRGVQGSGGTSVLVPPFPQRGCGIAGPGRFPMTYKSDPVAEKLDKVAIAFSGATGLTS